jgi:hypothetical protein
MVERARMILACLDGKEIQQVAKELIKGIGGDGFPMAPAVRVIGRPGTAR